MAAGDAAFDVFTDSPAGPQGHAPRLLQDGRFVGITLDGRTIREPHPGLVAVAPSAPTFNGGNGPVQSNISWVHDFEQMQLGNGGNAVPGVTAMSPQAVTPPQLNWMHQPTFTPSPDHAYMGQGGQMMMATSVGPPHLMRIGTPGRPAERFYHYPYSVALAASTEEALEAAFAAYDQDFRHEMDQWMTQQDPEGTTAASTAYHDKAMKKIADDLDKRRAAGDASVLPQNDPENRARLKAQEDQELCKHAQVVLDIMELGNEKFKKSSFTDLMRRIVNREVVVQGNEIIDVATGQPTDPTARDSEGRIVVPPMPTTIIPPSDDEQNGEQGAATSSST